MKKPILIIEYDTILDEEEKKRLEDEIKNHESLKDFEVMIFWQARAKIYYPPNEYNDAQPE